jgi:hypothetical protein
MLFAMDLLRKRITCNFSSARRLAEAEAPRCKGFRNAVLGGRVLIVSQANEI